MEWLLEHLQVIIIVAGAIAYWLNQRREKQGTPADNDEDGIPDTKPPQTAYDPTSMEAEEAERTRHLMEEMRRKRMERTANPSAPIAPAPASQPPVVIPQPRRFETSPPVFQDPLAEMMKDLAKRYAPQPEPVAPAIDPGALARQRELEEKMRILEAEKRATLRRAAEMRNSSELQARAAPHGENAANLLGSLRDPASLRKAIVLNEILGKPVALR